MLKFHLKKSRLNFTEAWMTENAYMAEDDLDKVSNSLTVLLKPDFQADLDRILLAIKEEED